MWLRLFLRSERREKARVIKDEMRRLLDDGECMFAGKYWPSAPDYYYQQMADKIVELAITDPGCARRSIATFLPLIEMSKDNRRENYMRSLHSGQPCS
jgi:hypothetical protein